MRPKSLVLMILAVSCGLVAAIGINRVLASRNAVVVEGETRAILVAMDLVSPGQEITPEMVKIEQWPVDKVPEGALDQFEDAEGRRLKMTLYAGEPLLDAKLWGSDAKDNGFSQMVPEGHRVVPVKVDSVSGGSGLIYPNDRVDVLAYFERNVSRGIEKTETRTLLQDVKVFAVDSTVNRGIGEGDQSVSAKTISLLLTPRDAQIVTMAGELGKIRLVMRSIHDDGGEADLNVSLNEILGLEDPDEQEEAVQSPVATLPTLDGPLVEGTENGEKPFRMTLVEGPNVREVEFDSESNTPREVSRYGSGGSAENFDPFAGVPGSDPNESAEESDADLVEDEDLVEDDLVEEDD